MSTDPAATPLTEREALDLRLTRLMNAETVDRLRVERPDADMLVTGLVALVEDWRAAAGRVRPAQDETPPLPDLDAIEARYKAATETWVDPSSTTRRGQAYEASAKDVPALLAALRSRVQPPAEPVAWVLDFEPDVYALPATADPDRVKTWRENGLTPRALVFADLGVQPPAGDPEPLNEQAIKVRAFDQIVEAWNGPTDWRQFGKAAEIAIDTARAALSERSTR